MTAKYLVRKIKTCPVCEGTGIVQNADWARINAENNAWMKANGYSTFNDAAVADWERRIKEAWPYRNPPQEEEPCAECEGAGQIETWIDLAQALIEIGAIHPQQLPDWQERCDALDTPDEGPF